MGFMMFQAARQWIPQAGVAQRLGVSPRPMIADWSIAVSSPWDELLAVSPGFWPTA